MTYYKKLEQLRLENELTKRDIAKILNVSESTYGKWELGQRKPDIDTIIKLADLFSVSADYLLGISNNARPGLSTHHYIENGHYMERVYSDKTGKNEIKKIAPIMATPMETAIAYFYAKKGRNPTDEELNMFIDFTKPVLDSLPDKPE